MTAWFPIVLALTMLVILAFGFLELEYGSQAQTIMSENGTLITMTVAWVFSLGVDAINAFFFYKKKGN